jgi:hypothetical protein
MIPAGPTGGETPQAKAARSVAASHDTFATAISAMQAALRIADGDGRF